MSLKVYFVRHGESIGNVHEETGDIPTDWDQLTDTGWQQAKALGNRLASEELTHIVCSPLQRAQQTAQAINEVLDLPLETADDIYELRQPSRLFKVPLKERGELYASHWMKEHDDDPDFCLEDAESFNQVMARVDALLHYLEQHATDKRVLVVTHGNLLRLLFGRVMWGQEMKPRHIGQLYTSLHTANTGISILSYDPDYPHAHYQAVKGWAIDTWMDHAHL